MSELSDKLREYASLDKHSIFLSACLREAAEELDTRERFDITPAQYHAGVDKLWDALGLSGPQDEDVFTLAAKAIRNSTK